MRFFLRIIVLIISYQLFLPIINCNAVVNKNKIPDIWNAPSLNNDFIGRESSIKEMKNKFNLKENNIVIINGMAGVGKTQLAKKYIHKNYHSYDIVWWFDFKKDLREQYKNLYYALCKKFEIKFFPDEYLSEEDILKNVKEILRTTDLNWLLIYDSIERVKSINDYLILKQANGLGHILITTKKSTSISKNILELKEFSRNESLTLLKKLYNNENLEELNQLADALYDYPIAISRSALYLNYNQSVKVKNYIELLKTKRKSLWRVEKNVMEKLSLAHGFDEEHLTSIAAIDIDIEELKKQAISEAKDDNEIKSNYIAYKLLLVCSFLKNQSISDDILRQYVTKIEGRSELEADLAIGTLINNRIIERKTDKKNDNNYFIHEMVQSAIIEKLTQKEEIQLFGELLILFDQLLPFTLDPIEAAKRYNTLEQAVFCSNYAKDIITLNPWYFKIKLREMEYYSENLFDFNKAELIDLELKDLIKRKSKRIEVIELVRYYLKKSVISSFKDNNIEAIKEAEFALTLINKNNYPNELFAIYNQLAQYHLYIGDLDQASFFTNQAEVLLITYKSLIEDSGVLFWVMAKISLDRGDYDKAYEYINKDLATIENVDESYKVLAYVSSHLLLSEILIKKGDAIKANEILTKIYLNFKEVYKDKDHDFVAKATSLLAQSYFYLRDIKNAAKFANQAIIMYQNIYGKNGYNSDTAYVTRLYGDILHYHGDLSGAYDQYKYSELLYKKTLQQEAIDDLSILYFSLIKIAKDSNDEGIVNIYFNKHTNLFGIDHPRTLEITKYLTF
jgi:hypothetical protein